MPLDSFTDDRRNHIDMGVRLVSFAVHWVKAEMHEFIIRNWRIVKIATTKAQRKLFFKLRSLSNRFGWNSPDDVAFVADTLNVPEAEVRTMEARMNSPDRSFDAAVSLADSGDSYSPADYLAAPAADPALLLESGDLSQQQSSQLYNAMEQLDERSRDIVQKRWLKQPKTTLHELADEYQISAERVRQLESAAFKQLKTAISVTH